MRLWHKSLIPYLPRQQLLGQWRECCCIAKNIAEKGTPNHILVNKIMDYPLVHFNYYSALIYRELCKRKYKADWLCFQQWSKCSILELHFINAYFTTEQLFSNWHTRRYLKQCFYNLEEKHDCQGVTDDEWNVLLKGYKEITGRDWEVDIS